MNNEQLINIISLIRDNLQYLLRKSSLAILAVLIVFSLLIAGFFQLSGVPFKFSWMGSLWLGAFCGLLIMNYCYPLGFWIIKKQEIKYWESPSKLFDWYLGSGLIMTLCLIGIPLLGMLVSLFYIGEGNGIFYLLGFSLVTLFLRLGSGLFAKGADLSAYLLEKTNANHIPRDDFRNVASIADKIGDFFNNGLALCMDLSESFIAIFTSFVTFIFLHRTDGTLGQEEFVNVLMYPLMILIGSLFVGFIAVFLFVLFKRRTTLANSLKPLHALYVALFLLVIYIAVLSIYMPLPAFAYSSVLGMGLIYSPMICVILGVILAVVIGVVTDYYTSESHKPLSEVISFSENSEILNILTGISVGMKSMYIPVLLEIFFVFITVSAAGVLGILLLGCGLLAMAPVIIAVALYAPYTDNYAGIVRMGGQQSEQLGVIEQYNSIGNTLSALARNFSAHAVLLVVFSLFISFAKMSGLQYLGISLFNPIILCALLIGGLLPFLLSSILLRALSYTTIGMLEDAVIQVNNIPYLKENKSFPDIHSFIKANGAKIVRDLIVPVLFILLIPIIIGKFLGTDFLAATLIGLLVSGLFMAVSYVNTGTVLDNCKKLLERGYFGGQNTTTYTHAEIGDLFGDGLKDLIGPAITSFIKIVIILTIVIIPII